jgi:hypothetical protein
MPQEIEQLFSAIAKKKSQNASPEQKRKLSVLSK